MSDLPTKPGAYYWRESDGDKWEHIIVIDPGNGHLYGHDGVVATSLHDWEQDYGAVGEWFPIPTAEELVELQAKAKMVDEGDATYGIYNGKGEFMWSDSFLNLREKSGLPIGYTCEPVTIIRKAKR